MTKEQGTLVDHIGVDLWVAARAFEQAMFDSVAALGFADVSVADSEILVAIPAKGARMTDVAKSRRVTKQAAQERIKSLIARGYLRTEPDPDDRRAQLLRHTERGRALRHALDTVKRGLHAEIVQTLGPEDVDRLRLALAEIVRQVSPAP
ncbi:MAG: MarR family winged helix-turn-helix transcriptional regulator [Pseudomonadota bacterium]